MKAIFELEFKLSNFFDKESIKKDFNGDVLKAMKWLYKMDGIGIFDRNPKLIKIIK